MREIDTETPVVWPAWCYQSGESTQFYSTSHLKFFSLGGEGHLRIYFKEIFIKISSQLKINYF